MNVTILERLCSQGAGMVALYIVGVLVVTPVMVLMGYMVKHMVNDWPHKLESIGDRLVDAIKEQHRLTRDEIKKLSSNGKGRKDDETK